MTELRARNLRFSHRHQVVLRGVSMALNQGELVVLLGPNGAGKTTLLRLLLGLALPERGRALIDGRDSADLAPDERARRVAYLPQQRELAWPTRVRDIVALGRYAFGAAPGRLAETDRLAVERALQACELTSLAERSAATLSGGEQARMHCARALAAHTPLLLADEPTAALDPLHQHRVLRLFRDYADTGGGALLVLHDVALAARYADRLLWLHGGELVGDGSVAETLTTDRLREVYGVVAEVRDGREVVIRGEA